MKLGPEYALGYLISGFIYGGLGFLLLRRWWKLFQRDPESAMALGEARGGPVALGLMLVLGGGSLIILGLASVLFR